MSSAAYWLAILAIIGFVVVLVMHPRWTLEAQHLAVSLPWLREMAILYAALLVGLVVAAILTTDRRAVVVGSLVAILVSVGVDWRRWSRWGLIFDAVMVGLLVTALVG